jgi:hypothetical protein
MFLELVGAVRERSVSDRLLTGELHGDSILLLLEVGFGNLSTRVTGFTAD